MTTVERIFYAVLALASPSDVLPLARALRAVELHISREWVRAFGHVYLELLNLRIEVKSLRAFKAGVDEALNSGDGSYRP